MRWIELRYRLEYGVFRAVAWLFGILPVETASNLSGFIWRHVAPLLRRHRRALRQLELSYPELPPADRERIARDMWEILGRTFAEFFHLPALLNSDRVDGTAVSDAARAHAGAGMVVCAAHQGNWEGAPFALLRAGL